MVKDVTAPVEAFPIGVYLKEEMDERGWGKDELLVRCPSLSGARLDEVLSGRADPLLLKEIEELSSLFGVDPALVGNLDRSYHKWRLSDPT